MHDFSSEYRKMGRKNFSFGLAFHDKKSKIRINPPRIIDFFIQTSPSRIQRSTDFSFRSALHDTKSKNYTVKSLIKFEYNIAKSGRKTFSFGLALHDKKAEIRISPSRIIDFSFGSALQESKGQRS